MKRSHHLSLGNSTVGPVGYCARIEAENAQDAIAKLKTILEELDYVSGELWSGPDGQYLQVYFNASAISEEDIDGVGDASYIRDDNGGWWYFEKDEGRIKCVGDDTPDGGYLCMDLEHGVRILNRLGYITEPAED